jgi:hypothetical protein
MLPRFWASAAAACGLWATSSTVVGRPGQHLEAARQLDQGQAGAHFLGADRQLHAQRFQRGQRGRGIQQLVGAAQGRIGQRIAALGAPP